MQPETPALGISRSDSWDDAMVYNVECSCTDPDHSIVSWIEIGQDPDINEIDVTFYVQTDFRGWRKLHQRIAEAWRVLVGGRSVRHHSLLLKKQAALNFSAAVNQSIEDLENGNTQPDS